MLVMRIKGADYPITWHQPSAGDAHSISVWADGRRIAALKWNAHTGEIRAVRVGFNEDDAKEFRRLGIATALLKLARTRAKVRHAALRTDAGEAWARSLGERLPKRAA